MRVSQTDQQNKKRILFTYDSTSSKCLIYGKRVFFRANPFSNKEREFLYVAYSVMASNIIDWTFFWLKIIWGL